MKRVLIIFVILFVMTAIIPFSAVIKNNQKKQQETVNPLQTYADFGSTPL